ncbi:hypothetical protein [Streptomyces sp. NPDC058665]|uniref:hypothetical protein n=1 Tax=Streptomyces sp. NPDC058665 TaxID=3346586 RepID=UPI003658CB05
MYTRAELGVDAHGRVGLPGFGDQCVLYELGGPAGGAFGTRQRFQASAGPQPGQRHQGEPASRSFPRTVPGQ